MPQTGPETRAVASRVAGLLRDRGRTDEAVAILSAYAAAFANDADGQGLLAEALRLDQNSAIARKAFERMEGVPGEHAALDEIFARYTLEELTKLEKTLRPGVFQRAQVGFNNNIKYKGAEYHVQTEDSGLDKPHVITHLFADGGRIIKSHKRTYADDVGRADVTQFVRALMKGQHMEMVLHLREGKFDEIIAGRAPGGLETLEHPPKVDLDRIGKGAQGKGAPKAVFKVQGTPNTPSTPAAAPISPSQPAPPPVVVAKVAAQPVHRARLHVLRSLYGGPDYYDVHGDESFIGSAGSVKVEGDPYCHPKEAALVYDAATGLSVLDLEGGNGVFLRIQRRVEIGLLDEFLVGDQLLRLERNPDPNDGPSPGPTYFRSSLKWPSAFRVAQILEGAIVGAVRMARGTTLQIGSAIDYANDMVFRTDPLVSPYHCVIEEQAEAFILSDLADQSTAENAVRSGVFVRVLGRHNLRHGAELSVGRTRLLVDLSPTDPNLRPLG